MRLGKILVLGALPLDQVGNGVEPEAVDSHVEPKTHDAQHLFEHPGIVEVQVGLVGVEPVPEKGGSGHDRGRLGAELLTSRMNYETMRRQGFADQFASQADDLGRRHAFKRISRTKRHPQLELYFLALGTPPPPGNLPRLPRNRRKCLGL